MSIRFQQCMSAIVVFAAAATVQAQIGFDVIVDGTITDASADGQWAAGFLNDGGIFRWSRKTGVEILNADSSYNGLVGISHDGSRVTASIFNSEGTAGPGLWTQGSGWSYLGPIPGGGVAGEDGSSYAISDDGTTVTGLAWRPDFTARAFSWTQSSGMVNLGASYDDRSSRGSAINGDGSVIGGFDEAEFGNRRPAVWVNGSLTVLDPDGVGEVNSVNSVGNIVGGTAGFDLGAAIWNFDSGTWTRTDIGYLDGTDPIQRSAAILAITSDGSMAVGYNASGFGPFADYNGTIWTPDDGLMNAEDWLADKGVDIGGMDIRELTGISDDGMTIYGFGFLGGFTPMGFQITIPTPSVAAPLALAGLVATRRRRH